MARIIVHDQELFERWAAVVEAVQGITDDDQKHQVATALYSLDLILAITAGAQEAEQAEQARVQAEIGRARSVARLSRAYQGTEFGKVHGL